MRILCQSMLALLLLSALGCSTSPKADSQAAAQLQQSLNELLAADQSYADASLNMELADGISAMFADDVTMPIADGEFAQSRDAAKAALTSNPDNVGAHATWAPARAAISADGLHGMSLGSMRVTKADQSSVPAKYLAYWIKGVDGWKVSVYRRVRSGTGDAAALQLPHVLPARALAPSDDSAKIQAFSASLNTAELAFSDAAQKIGLGPAFVQYGATDSINLGGASHAGFVVGANQIGQLVSEGLPPGTSPVHWSPDRVIVASSGDLGVTIGKVLQHTAVGAEAAPPIPFFTIWHRADPSQPWRYLAQ